MSNTDDKRALRRHIRQLKASFKMSDEQRFALADNVFTTIERHLRPMDQAQHILMYYELPDELPTSRWAMRWQQAGKHIYLPRMKGDTLEVVALDTHLTPDTQYGILEPTGAPLEQLSLIDVAIVPAVALDRQGNRLGRGKGYYDRLLPQLSQATTVGVSYDFQLVDHVPTAELDIPLNYVVTPSFHNFH